MVCCGASFAQNSTSGTPAHRFEVVSIKENPSHLMQPGGMTPNGYRVPVMPLVFLLLGAYVPESPDFVRYGPENIQGMPDWAKSTAFDIDARISDADRTDWQDPKRQPEMQREMLQALLADRFKLVVHREMKEMPVYDLVVAKGGPKFQVATGQHPAGASLLSRDGGFQGPSTGGVMHYYNVPIKTLSSALSGVWSGRPVLDRTELTGRYDINLGSFLVGGFMPPADSDSQTVFSAVGNLGLKLEPAKDQVEMLVIDHIEKPTTN